MGILIDTSDFADRINFAKFYIPFSSSLCGSTEQLEGYIKRYEKKCINQLLGVDLANLFIADLVDQVPQQDIYLAIYNPIEKDLTNDDNSQIYYSSLCGCKNKQIETNGMKSLLMGLIFFQYMRDQPFSKEFTGVSRKIAENSENSSFYQWGIAEHYNESVKDYQETQYYILLEKNENDIYQEFNGVKKQFTSTLF
jgi:hypothetical protein